MMEAELSTDVKVKLEKFGKITKLVVENHWVCTGNIILAGIEYPLVVFRYTFWIKYRIPYKILKLGTKNGIFCLIDLRDNSVNFLPLNGLYALINPDVDESETEFRINFWRLDEVNKLMELNFHVTESNINKWKALAVDITDCVNGSHCKLSNFERDELFEPTSLLKKVRRDFQLSHSSDIKSNENYYVELIPGYIELDDYLTTTSIYHLHRFRIYFIIPKLDAIKSMFYFSSLLRDLSIFRDSGLIVEVWVESNEINILKVFDSSLNRFLTNDELEYQEQIGFNKNKNWSWLF